MTAEDVIRLLDLRPLPDEGGFFRETYRSATRHADRSVSTAIYYLISAASPSRWHRIASDELWHHYAGDPAEQVVLLPDGSARRQLLGSDLAVGHRPQSLVPARAWQSTRLVAGGRWALFGATVAPGFEFADYERGEPERLRSAHPAWAAVLAAQPGES